ncbi:MAG: NAD(P)-binding domain-containing protein, partial [Propionibacterium sp.]|nr:NAD(P)-binding domain-containing protein [Propionibacterium sp.]
MSAGIDRSPLLDAVIIGAGQAGLSAGFHLRRRGLRPHEDFVMLDANDGPGGAWRHRWPSLTLGKAHGIHDLPQYPLGTPDPEEPSSDVVSRYYGEYEAKFDLPVIRPAKVERVTSEPDGDLAVRAGDRLWRTRFLINSTGTWDSPFW